MVIFQLGESSAHDSLAVKLCNEVLLDPQSIRVGVLSRALPMLELSPNLQDNLTDLSVLCEQMIEVRIRKCYSGAGHHYYSYEASG